MLWQTLILHPKLINILCLVPPSRPVIMSESGHSLVETSKHLMEGATAVLICETIGGDPLPRLTWYVSHA